MSRAFVKESDDAGEPLPELVISPHPNYVTPNGLSEIETRVAALAAEQQAARESGDKSLLARIARDLRYWTQRRATARIVEPSSSAPDVVRFGVTAVVRFEDGTERSFKLVGEDEADPARGLVSWVAPLAKSLTGKGLGDELEVLGRVAEIVRLTI